MTSPTQVSDRLGYIEGLRGVAVAAVLLFHAGIWSALPAGRLNDALAIGHTGVDLFFVISGFCMMWPLVRRGDGSVMPLAVGTYLRKRFLRIAPPFYAAVGVAVLASLVMWGLGGASWWHQPMQSVFPTTSANLAGNLATHLTFTHGLVPRYDRSIDGAFWSLAVEWQFYLLLPALVLVARRWSVRAAVAVTVAIPLLYVAVTHVLAPGFSATTVGGDLVLLRLVEFGAGMAVASLAANGTRRVRAPLVAVALAAAVTVDHLRPTSVVRPFLWAAAFGAAVLAISGSLPMRRMLEAAAVRWVGRISYSAYLVHGSVYMLLATIGTHFTLATPLRCVLFFAIGPPLALLAATALHRSVEVPAQRWAHQRATPLSTPLLRQVLG